MGTNRATNQKRRTQGAKADDTAGKGTPARGEKVKKKAGATATKRAKTWIQAMDEFDPMIDKYIQDESKVPCPP